MKRIIISILILFSFFLLIYKLNLLSYTSIEKNSQKNIRPNILVLSFCSLRQEDLTPYNQLQKTTPNISDFSKKSFIFKNGISGTSWTNALNFVGGIPKSFFETNGYHLPGLYSEGTYIRIPKRKGLELEYIPDLEYLKNLILTPQHRPFYLGVHIKYQHFPYYDWLHKNNNIYESLSLDSKNLLYKYMNKPLSYPDKLSLLTMLFRDRNIILANPKVESIINKFPNQLSQTDPYGLINNSVFLNDWKNSKSFNLDLKLLHEIYSLKLKNLDAIIEPVLNLYHDKDLQNNTIVILVGDHGDALMEHNHLYHGDTVFDEMIRFPLLIKFPNSKLFQSAHVEDQFFQGELAEVIKKLVSGELNEDNFQVLMQNSLNKSKAIVSRTCDENIKSIRYQNKWKLIKNYATRSDLLFNLETDPKEKNNIYSSNPEIIGKLEELLIENDKKPDAEWNINCESSQ